MRKKRWFRNSAIVGLAAALLLPAAPGERHAAEAAGDDLEVRFGMGTLIGNLSHSADNAFLNFNSETSGFEVTQDSDNTTVDWSKGDLLMGDDDTGSRMKFKLDLSDSDVDPNLKALAASGDAEVEIGWSKLEYQDGWILLYHWELHSAGWIRVDGVTKVQASTTEGDSDVGARSTTVPLESDTVIEIEIHGDGTDSGNYTGVRGLYIKFRDKNRPTLNAYTFTGNGAERTNSNIDQQELYVKQSEHITLSYNFSEPVRPTALNASFNDHFLRHPLFVNPAGTGLPAAGEQQYLLNQTYTASNLGSYKSEVVYKYTASKYHHSGNLPLEPKITGSDANAALIDRPLEQKFKDAVFADPAGNVATITFPGKADGDSNDHVAGRTLNPFDYDGDGYRVIVDAVAPKYTKTGNGIQPEIVTGVVLNDGDRVEFRLKLTEEAIVKSGWDPEGTYLQFDNGMKAYYVSGSGTDSWLFGMDIPGDAGVETPLLKVLALTHDDKPGETDGSVLQDYAGNLLIQPANFEGVHVDGDESNVNSKIDWAALSVDNTASTISFRYENGGASNAVYKKTGKVTIDVNDAPIQVAALDPNVSERGKDKPSQGIYRPSNMTGASSPAVGIVYYWWSRDAEDPFADKSGDQFAAVKRYSLAAKQPREDLYPGEFAELNLTAVNNKTNLLAPPSQAYTDEGSGEWFLHSWTADMTWDSARELMQYDKMKSYAEEHLDQYEAWKAEASGSEADKTVYANNKALEAVGQYGDATLWPVSDFKQDDSNWTYAVATVKYDNRPPSVNFADASGDGTADVGVTAGLSDEHSGINEAWYQWVPEGGQPKPVDWRSIAHDSGEISVGTLNEVTEDGQYRLYVKVSDHAGNVRESGMSSPVTVNSEAAVTGSFSPAADTEYTAAHDVVFRISGAEPEEDGGEPFVEYAFAPGSVRPAAATAYTRAVQTQVDDQPSFVIPADASKNGIVYVHVKVKERGAERYYYFYRAYYFDNVAPEVAFSVNGVGYPQAEHEVTVTVTELYSTGGLTSLYQWVRDGEPEPDEHSEAWLTLPGDGVVAIDDAGLSDGEVADYRLYVMAEDGAGNRELVHTNVFKVSAAGRDDSPAAPLQSDLVYLYGDSQDGYTAIIKLDLDTEDVTGYSYSVSPDNGVSWVNWRPYTNFVAVEVATGNPEQLKIQFKVKTPGGVTGEPKLLSAGPNVSAQPVYALASLSTVRPVSAAAGIDIVVAPPPGIKVVPAAANPSVPVRTGNTFHVNANGYYTFELSDLADPDRTDRLIISVANVDATPPQGTVEYIAAPAQNGVRGNVAVKLRTSEPVHVTNNDGRFVRTFTENGSFTFEFADEAGNTGTAAATVVSIDKEGPNVQIVHSFAYGENGGNTFQTIEDNGEVLLASGVTLEVQKADPSDEDFFVPGGRQSVELTENGEVSFLVTDAAGNTTVVKEQIDFIVSEAPPATVSYTFVDESGEALPPEQIVEIDGRPYARGYVRADISGAVAAPNLVFSGVVPVEEDGEFANRISGDDGTFVYSRTYSANGATFAAISDWLGHVNKVPIVIAGLDNAPPELELRQSAVGVAANKPDFDIRADLGGYTVRDNVSHEDDIEVTIAGLDLTSPGRQQVTYTAKDQVGNVSTAVQSVFVLPEGGMIIFGNGTVISASLGESALYDTNRITFEITGFDRMDVNGAARTNERALYDVYYRSGLYREGQMKYIASRMTYAELADSQYTVEFPQAGWYTLIVRNQEREREYATFFVGSVD